VVACLRVGCSSTEVVSRPSLPNQQHESAGGEAICYHSWQGSQKIGSCVHVLRLSCSHVRPLIAKNQSCAAQMATSVDHATKPAYCKDLRRHDFLRSFKFIGIQWSSSNLRRSFTTDFAFTPTTIQNVPTTFNVNNGSAIRQRAAQEEGECQYGSSAFLICSRCCCETRARAVAGYRTLRIGFGRQWFACSALHPSAWLLKPTYTFQYYFRLRYRAP
jgi:hypothetical protein